VGDSTKPQSVEEQLKLEDMKVGGGEAYSRLRPLRRLYC
jgi:hypothetical protein